MTAVMSPPMVSGRDTCHLEKNVLCKQGTPILRSGRESDTVRMWLVPAAGTWDGAVKVDLIPADVQWIAAVKLDLILSCQIVALDQSATSVIRPQLTWLHHAPRGECHC